jgi:formamidopyrimidine-DNA glycosylase
MQELPDLTIYLEAMSQRFLDQPLVGLRVANPFILRTAEPPITSLLNRKVTGLRRVGKRLILELEQDYFILIHLMIAGRLKWHDAGHRIPGKIGLLAFDFPTGTMILTEAGQKHRASVHLIAGETNLTPFDPGGIDVLACTYDEFVAALSRENHTLKRSLTDQRFLSGIGNAYSDEILFRAGISPMRQIRHLKEEQWQRLYEACKTVLAEWTDLLRQQSKGKFPAKVTAFHPEMTVHGKYKQPCAVCGYPVQRIRYANNEANYCAKCQNQGNLLADRSLSRLLKKDWPKTLEELDSDG